MKCCSCCTLCCEIFSACLSVHVLHLSCFSVHLTSIFFPPFLAPVFPFLLPGNLLPPVDVKRFVSTLCTKLFFHFQTKLKNVEEGVGSEDLCSYVLSYVWALHRYRRMLQGRKETWPVAIFIDGRRFAGGTFFSWAITEMLLLSHSWMRSSDRTWRSPCSRNTSSRVRRVSRRLWINSSKRCGSHTECPNHSWFTGRQELPPNPPKSRTTLGALDSLMLFFFCCFTYCVLAVRIKCHISLNSGEPKFSLPESTIKKNVKARTSGSLHLTFHVPFKVKNKCNPIFLSWKCRYYFKKCY